MNTQAQDAKKELRLIPKARDHAFEKDVYLLGRRDDGARLWLEASRWDCGWYWAFGYVVTYGVRSNDVQPSAARDIHSHEHVESLIFKRREVYDAKAGAFVLRGEYLHHWNEQPDLTETTLTEAESWQFADLMKSFYTLKAAAQVYRSGNSHLTSTPGLDLKNGAGLDRINKVEIPKITAAVFEILMPPEP